MTDNVKKLLELVKNDPELMEKARTLTAKDVDEAKKVAVAFAAEQGITLTEDDFTGEAKDNVNQADDDELAAVAGGGCYCQTSGTGLFTQDAEAEGNLCVIIGGSSDSKGTDII